MSTEGQIPTQVSTKVLVSHVKLGDEVDILGERGNVIEILVRIRIGVPPTYQFTVMDATKAQWKLAPFPAERSIVVYR